jgi:tetratricopeptide (TPR) repeat protein
VCRVPALAAGLLALWLSALPTWGQTVAPPAAPKAASPAAAGPRRVLVFPVDNLRKPGEPFWLADWLQEALSKSLLRTEALAVADRETAGQWRAQFATGPLADLPRDAWERLGADAVVQVTVQPVLNLVDVRLRVQSHTGDRLPPDAAALRIDLGSDAPGAVLERLLTPLRKALALDEKAAATPAAPQPGQWKALETAYTRLAEPLASAAPQARPERVQVLQPLADDPALRGRIYEAMARLSLEQALLHERDAGQRRDLAAALRYVEAALVAEPWDTDRRALKGEIHYFLRQDYPAKTEASIARLKNPANGLAYAVLGLLAGPSSGEGTEQLKRAQRADPFLWASARAAGQPPFQAGVLEAALQKWAQRQAGAGSRRAAIAQEMTPTLQEGIALFQAKRWEEAQTKLRQAANEDEYDYRPVLYQLRILIETGHAPEAVPPLRELAAENPAEADIQLQLAVALVRSGALEDARPQLEAVLQENPRQPLALYYRALSDIAEKRWSQAAEGLRAVVGQEPRHEAAWFNLGVAQANLEQWRAADEAFAHVLALNPQSSSAQEWRARVRPHLNP